MSLAGRMAANLVLQRSENGGMNWSAPVVVAAAGIVGGAFAGLASWALAEWNGP